MNLSTLTAISPIDGRYASKADALRPIVSEFGLMRARIEVELNWIKSLANNPQINEVPPLSEQAILRTSMPSLMIFRKKTVKALKRLKAQPTMM